MLLRLAAASLRTSAQLLTYASLWSNYGTLSGTTFTLDATVFVDLSPGYGRNASNVTALNNRCGLGHNGWLDEARF